MAERTYEQMYAEAGQRLQAIRTSGEEPAECHFLVSEYERCVLLDRPPFRLREMDPMRTRFMGMRITVRHEQRGEPK